MNAIGAEAYRQSWKIIASREQLGPDFANRYFSEVVRLYYDQPSKPANTGKGADYFTEGYVVTAFTVNADGTLGDFEIVESKPIQMAKALFRRAIRKARYRPRVVDGEPVQTPDVRIRNTYDYADR